MGGGYREVRRVRGADQRREPVRRWKAKRGDGEKAMPLRLRGRASSVSLRQSHHAHRQAEGVTAHRKKTRVESGAREQVELDVLRGAAGGWAAAARRWGVWTHRWERD